MAQRLQPIVRAQPPALLWGPILTAIGYKEIYILS